MENLGLGRDYLIPHNEPQGGKIQRMNASKEYPKNLLRLFLRNNLKGLKITSNIKNNLKNCHSYDESYLILQCILRGLLKITSEN